MAAADAAYARTRIRSGCVLCGQGLSNSTRMLYWHCKRCQTMRTNGTIELCSAKVLSVFVEN